MRRRRGTIYIVTLSTTLIVALMSTSALMIARVQRKTNEGANDVGQALLYAESALQMAKYRLRTDSNWRSKLDAGTWAVDQPIGAGYYSITGYDPLDGNLQNRAYDPVVIVATGKHGSTVRKLSLDFQVRQPGINCLSSTVHAHGDLVINPSTITASNAPMSSNGNIPVNQSQVTADLEAALAVNKSFDSTVFGSIRNGVAPRTMPNSTDVMNYYSNLATNIPVTALPFWDRNYLTNPGAESGTTGWQPNGLLCQMAQSSAQRHSGTYSFQIFNRLPNLGSPLDAYIFQDVTAQLAQNLTYHLEARVYSPTIGDNFRLQIYLDTTTGVTTFSTPWKAVPANFWTKAQGTVTLNWSGTLNQARFLVQSQASLGTFYLDDCILTESGAKNNYRVIHRELIGPQSNPFTGLTNSQGIYVIDLAGSKFSIRDCRIHGTLILKNVGSNSSVEGSVNWTPIVAHSIDPSVPNLPLLVSGSVISLETESTDLNEQIVNRNFNPNSTPYQGQWDTDRTDIYPSKLTGLIYGLTDLDVKNRTNIQGTVVTHLTTRLNGPGITIRHEPVLFHTNPPIGFRASPVTEPVTRSLRQVAN